MLRAVLLEPVGLLVGCWQEDPGVEEELSPHAHHASLLARAPIHAAWSRGTAAWLLRLVCGRAGKGRVKPLKPSQLGQAFAPVACRRVAVTGVAFITSRFTVKAVE